MKYYLICSFCNHYNEVTSEYLTFCDNCKKKLHINFREWQKHHPDGTIHDFELQECVSSIPESPDENSGKKKVSLKLNWLKIALVILLFVPLLIFIFSDEVSNNITDSIFEMWSGEERIEFNWERQTYGDYGLSIESPVKLEHISLPSTQPQIVEDAQPFSSDLEQAISLVVISTKFNAKAGKISLQTSISNFIYQIQNMPNISDFTVNQSETTISGIPGFEQKGTFMQNGQVRAFISVGVSRGMMLWQIMVLYNQDDVKMEEAANRIISSAQIFYNSAA